MSEKKKKADTKKSQKGTRKSSPPEQIETAALADAPMLEQKDDAVVGTLSAETEPSSDAPVESAKRSIRKKDSAQKDTAKPPDAPASAPSVLSANEPVAESEPLRLPRGAFVALRKSGGLHFTTREVVVYPDGRVAYDARGVPQKEYTRLRRALNDGQVHSLRKLLDQTNFWMTAGGGKQNPDAYAYEIAARVGQRSNEIEVFDGSVPEKLQPLLERLVRLLPDIES